MKSTLFYTAMIGCLAAGTYFDIEGLTRISIFITWALNIMMISLAFVKLDKLKNKNQTSKNDKRISKTLQAIHVICLIFNGYIFTASVFSFFLIATYAKFEEVNKINNKEGK